MDRPLPHFSPRALGRLLLFGWLALAPIAFAQQPALPAYDADSPKLSEEEMARRTRKQNLDNAMSKVRESYAKGDYQATLDAVAEASKIDPAHPSIKLYERMAKEKIEAQKSPPPQKLPPPPSTTPAEQAGAPTDADSGDQGSGLSGMKGFIRGLGYVSTTASATAQTAPLASGNSTPGTAQPASSPGVSLVPPAKSPSTGNSAAAQFDAAASSANESKKKQKILLGAIAAVLVLGAVALQFWPKKRKGGVDEDASGEAPVSAAQSSLVDDDIIVPVNEEEIAANIARQGGARGGSALSAPPDFGIFVAPSDDASQPGIYSENMPTLMDEHEHEKHAREHVEEEEVASGGAPQGFDMLPDLSDAEPAKPAGNGKEPAQQEKVPEDHEGIGVIRLGESDYHPGTPAAPPTPVQPATPAAEIPASKPKAAMDTVSFEDLGIVLAPDKAPAPPATAPPKLATAPPPSPQSQQTAISQSDAGLIQPPPVPAIPTANVDTETFAPVRDSQSTPEKKKSDDVVIRLDSVSTQAPTVERPKRPDAVAPIKIDLGDMPPRKSTPEQPAAEKAEETITLAKIGKESQPQGAPDDSVISRTGGYTGYESDTAVVSMQDLASETFHGQDTLALPEAADLARVHALDVRQGPPLDATKTSGGGSSPAAAGQSEQGETKSIQTPIIPAATDFYGATTPGNLDERSERMFREQYDRAMKAYQKKDWKQAVHYFSIAAAIHPEDEDLRLKLRESRDRRRREEVSA